METPTLVYDDDCGFCTWWADYLTSQSSIRLVGFSELDQTPELRAALPEQYEDCSHLVTEDGVHSCGESIEQAFLRADIGGPVQDLVRFVHHFEEYQQVRDHGYEWVANNRDLLGNYLSKTPPARADGQGDE
ncbi:hypothetical protein C483_06600 [Natrialba hulunbeirensis JCM 10989]|uniref:Thiol-disulfide oxidoreductase DCC n=1 Tax=Natrialba hulunbeirensis JCM 10989 TaxID=1227493 RepID=M0A6L5_9EURY|nr:DCC1-like thiol-disulfide oxidoreductase family protein [Natrialba hulunbeirensis]ELY92978.1 hypothetical protein C483_06600 [Natrialba hulunbeirensis JCM 10989]